MNRRDLLAGGLLAAGTLAFNPRALAMQPATVTVHPDQPLGAISPDFMGLGYEISTVARPGVLSGVDSAYEKLVRRLGSRGIVRIGGNTADYAHYSPTAQAVSAPKATVINDAALEELGTFLNATGWQLIWGLNLGSGSEAEALAEAGAVTRCAGDKLLAFEIGNEPDLFPNEKHRAPAYNYEAWLADYRRYKQVLRAHYPQLPLAGPDVAGHTDWVTRFAADEGHDIVLLTHHYYRGGQANPSSTIDELLGPDPKLQPQLDILKAAAQSCGKPYRICEVNSFSGGGRPGVSDTFAGALWALDYMWTLAVNGCSGVNMETGVNQLGFVSSYSPIGDDMRGNYSAAPEYYGMLAFGLGAQGRLLRTEINGAPGIKAYAAEAVAGKPAITLINKTNAAADLVLRVEGAGGAKQASVLRLAAPAIDAKTGVTLGGAPVANGRWAPTQRGLAQLSSGSVAVHMPAAGAAIVQLAG